MALSWAGPASKLGRSTNIVGLLGKTDAVYLIHFFFFVWVLMICIRCVEVPELRSGVPSGLITKALSVWNLVIVYPDATLYNVFWCCVDVKDVR